MINLLKENSAEIETAVEELYRYMSTLEKFQTKLLSVRNLHKFNLMYLLGHSCYRLAGYFTLLLPDSLIVDEAEGCSHNSCEFSMFM